MTNDYAPVESREELIEKAAKAIWDQILLREGTVGSSMYRACIRTAEVAFAVFEQAHTPTDEPRVMLRHPDGTPKSNDEIRSEAAAAILADYFRRTSTDDELVTEAYLDGKWQPATDLKPGVEYALRTRRTVQGEPTDALEAVTAERDEARRWAETMQAQKFEWEGKEAAARAERDRYRAAIEEARTHEWSSFGDSGTYRILTAALDETKED